MLESDLSAVIRGKVCFDNASRALYATDASNYRQVPIGVVIPEDEQDVIRAFEVCYRHKVPVLPRGAGTSLAGQGCNEAVVLDTTHLNQILETNYQKKVARVQPGVVLDALRKETHPHYLTFGPDPATHNRCTFGGMIGNNACGVHSVMAGKTVDNVEELEILTYDGLRMRVGQTSDQVFEAQLKKGGRTAEIYAGLKSLVAKYEPLIREKFPKIPRRVSGYNLDQLLNENGFHVARALVGTEGTCVQILEAKLKLVPYPVFRNLLVIGYPDVFSAADHVPLIMKYQPIGLEGLDENFVSNMKKRQLNLSEIAMLPEGNAWLFAEFGGNQEDDLKVKTQELMNELQKEMNAPSAQLFINRGDQKKIWAIRESSFGATVFVPGVRDKFSGFEDTAVPPEKLGDYLRSLQKLYQKYDYDAITYGHFGDGCIHSRISFDFKSEAGVKKYREFIEEASDLVIQYGGSLSGEHGDGQNWGEFLNKMYGPELIQAFQEFKALWDPQNKMNPGKVVHAYPVDQNLKQQGKPKLDQGLLHFRYSQEKGNFNRVTERCIGIGKCLKTDSGIMCPSYKVTRDEKHSTRGRAHLLNEMMRGEVIHGGWKNEAVKEALDLCLSCKGCDLECPTGVDMATYKSEFLSKYYKGRLRPLHAYAFGQIDVWARLGSKMPAVTNWISKQTWFKKLLKIAPERVIPLFASQTFSHWFQTRTLKNTYKKEVLLWPDTFNNYFYPEIPKAATEVLEHLGWRVRVPDKKVCCGRPLYDYGMLDLAKKYLEKSMRVLKPYVDKGTPIVMLEPSCAAVFRDEIHKLAIEDRDIPRLSKQVMTLSEFLLQKNEVEKLPSLTEPAVVHGHCHQKAAIGMDADQKVFDALGLQAEILDAGCCGMAGAFGFEEDHYEVSIKVGEEDLLPKVRKSSEETLLMADGFSCREQIQHRVHRKPRHLAQILQKTLT